MLDFPFLLWALRFTALVTAGFTLAWNTHISGSVVNEASQMGWIVGYPLAIGLSICEVIFTSWVRRFEGWSKAIESFWDVLMSPGKLAWAIISLLVKLSLILLVYAIDIRTTADWARYRDLSPEPAYFWLTVGWLVFAPELLILGGVWLQEKAMQAERNQKDRLTHLQAELRRKRTYQRELDRLADEAGRAEAVAKAQQRWGM